MRDGLGDAEAVGMAELEWEGVVCGLALLLLVLLTLGVTEGVVRGLALLLLVLLTLGVTVGVLVAVADRVGLIVLVPVGDLLEVAVGDGEFVAVGVGVGSGSLWPGAHPTSTAAGQTPPVQFHAPYNVLPTQEPTPVHEMLQCFGGMEV